MTKINKGSFTDEAVKGFTHRTAIEEAARCLLCHDAPCSKSCPAKTDPAKFIRSIRFRNVKGAAETIRENNILGGTCARVCPYDRLCEEACSRCGIDKPIQIGLLQRYAIEQEEIFNMQTLEVSEQKKSQKIACVGSGPASLAVASELAKNGYEVTIFEREEKAGGMLTYGIAPSRLPQHVVEHDIKQVENLGVKFIFKKSPTKDELNKFDAVFVGTGLWGSNMPNIEGISLKGVYSAVDFLKTAHIKKETLNIGKKVVVIGGGDVAIDCAVSAKLLGAEDVKIVYRRTLEEAPGNINEFHYALSLGIGITTGMAPAKINGGEKVESIEFEGLKSKEDKLKLSVDTVIFATGQTAEKLDITAELDTNSKGLINVSESRAKGKYFAAGDIVNGGKTVVEAVKEGKEAAKAIIKYLESAK